MKKIYCLLALSALVTQAGGLAGQIVITVHSVPQCSECEIRIIPVTTLAWIPTLRYRPNVCGPPSPICEEVLRPIS